VRIRTGNLIAIAFAAAAGVAASASAAFAHGGMASPDELGRPLAASVAIAFVCYWAVVLWPSRAARNADLPSRKPPARRRRYPRAAGANGEARAGSLKTMGRGER